MRPAAAAFTAFLSRRASHSSSSSFVSTANNRMTVYSFSHRNSLARALSFNANGKNNNGGVASKVSLSSAASSPRSVSSQLPKKRALSSTSASSSSSSSSPTEDRLCSTRGTRAVDLLPVYLTDARAVERYCPDTCPTGALQLSVAENQMLEDLLVPAVREFASPSSDSAADAAAASEVFYADMIYYQPTPGRPTVRKAMADYLKRVLRLPGDLDTEGLVVGAGCNAVLENLCICLAEPGDAVLLPTPYYAAFEFDLVARAGLEIVPVTTMSHHPEIAIGSSATGAVPPEAYYPNRSALDAAVERARASGSEPKVLLLSHPNNPLGVCYPPSVVKECIEWGRENEIHIVSDEIYAGSVYRESAMSNDTTFESALSIAASKEDCKEGGLGIGPFVHFVYALSKDFCLSGLRVGAAYSENPDIRLPMQKLNDLCQISSQTQLLVERMLNAPSKVGSGSYWSTEDFLPEARRRMKTRCEKLERCLAEARIPHLTSDSGMFVWMDMREFLPPRNDGGDDGVTETKESIDKRERALYLELLQQHGLLFTPGRSMKNELPGYFRCVFTAASDHEFDLGLERILRFVNEKRAAT